MTRIATIVLALLVPGQAQAQAFEFGKPPGLSDQPRAAEIFAGVRGYADLTPERFGEPDSPVANELGMLLVLRMFRNVCLGLEEGRPLDAVMPPGYSVHDARAYVFGGEVEPSGSYVLSPTGDIEVDENDGHPSIWLSPAASGMTCKIEWQTADEIEPARQAAMARLLSDWLPYEMALVRANRPYMSPEPALTDGIEWDRACGGAWCPVSAIFTLSHGFVSLSTTLNTTGIEGSRP